jgi:hypothetical protein
VDEKHLPKNAAGARSLGVSHYFTNKHCRNGHLSIRRLSDNKCLECNKEMALKRRSNPKTNKIINAQRKRLRVDDGESAYSRSLESKKKRYKTDSSYRLRIRKSQIQREYGITYETFLLMIKIQNSRCAICKIKGKHEIALKKSTLFIDHDHDTGQVRGLLCQACNHALGKSHDNPQILREAAKYLRRRRKA